MELQAAGGAGFMASMTLAQKLNRLVQNQSEVSRKTGIAQSAISEAISKGRRLYVDQAFLIARALGVSLDYLADDEQDDPPSPPSEAERSVVELLHALKLPTAVALRRLATEVSEAERSLLNFYRRLREEGTPVDVNEAILALKMASRRPRLEPREPVLDPDEKPAKRGVARVVRKRESDSDRKAKESSEGPKRAKK